MGCTSQSTATPEATAHRLTLNPRSTRTGKVAAEANSEMQALSAKPQNRSGNTLRYHGRLTGFSDFFQKF